jgi:hypothetical protein
MQRVDIDQKLRGQVIMIQVNILETKPYHHRYKYLSFQFFHRSSFIQPLLGIKTFAMKLNTVLILLASVYTFKTSAHALHKHENNYIHPHPDAKDHEQCLNFGGKLSLSQRIPIEYDMLTQCE